MNNLVLTQDSFCLLQARSLIRWVKPDPEAPGGGELAKGLQYKRRHDFTSRVQSDKDLLLSPALFFDLTDLEFLPSGELALICQPHLAPDFTTNNGHMRIRTVSSPLIDRRSAGF